MAKDNDNVTQTVDPAEEVQAEAVEEAVVDTAVAEEVPAEEIPAEEIPAVKTKKELKKERKEIKKHKKEVKKEAKRHSAKRTKAQNFWLTVIMLFVIASMLACGFFVIKSYKNITGGAPAASEDGGSGSNSGSGTATTSPSANNGSSTETTTAAPAGEDSTGGAGGAPVDPDNADLSTPAGVVAYYKAAHDKVLTTAKSVTKTYDNTVNYKDVLEIGGNSTLEKVAKSLMGTFMKEDTEAHQFTGADIGANFPPKGGNCAGLTLDMVSEATCTEADGKYTIKITINSTDEAYDLGDKTKNLVSIVNEQEITDAAGSMVSLSGLENRYVGANLTATVDKATGNLIALETDVPSYMFFAQAKVAIIKVDNCRIGLEYMQKWTVEY